LPALASGETSSNRRACVLCAYRTNIAAATRNAETSRKAPSTLICGMCGAMISTPMPPPKCPTPSTSPNPVTRARVGKLSADRLDVVR
jgi:hypothetical protein